MQKPQPTLWPRHVDPHKLLAQIGGGDAPRIIRKIRISVCRAKPLILFSSFKKDG
jgi:hypothetical protein